MSASSNFPGAGELGGIFYCFQYYCFPTVGFQTLNQAIKSHLERRGTYLPCAHQPSTCFPRTSSVPRSRLGHPAQPRPQTPACTRSTGCQSQPRMVPLWSDSRRPLSALQVSRGVSRSLRARSGLAAGAGEWVSEGPEVRHTAKITNDLTTSRSFPL